MGFHPLKPLLLLLFQALACIEEGQGVVAGRGSHQATSDLLLAQRKYLALHWMHPLCMHTNAHPISPRPVRTPSIVWEEGAWHRCMADELV